MPHPGGRGISQTVSTSSASFTVHVPGPAMSPTLMQLGRLHAATSLPQPPSSLPQPPSSLPQPPSSLLHLSAPSAQHGHTSAAIHGHSSPACLLPSCRVLHPAAIAPSKLDAASASQEHGASTHALVLQGAVCSVRWVACGGALVTRRGGAGADHIVPAILGRGGEVIRELIHEVRLLLLAAARHSAPTAGPATTRMLSAPCLMRRV